MKKSELFFAALLVPVDILMVFLAFIVAYYFRQATGEVSYYWPIEQYMSFIFSVLPFWIAIFALSGLYAIKRSRQGWETIGNILAAVAGGTAVVMAWPFLTRQDFFSRLVVLYIFIFAVVFVAAGRFLVRWLQQFLYRYGVGVYHTLIVGNSPAVEDLLNQLMTKKSLGRHVFGYLTATNGNSVNKNANLPVIGSIDNFREALRSHYTDELIIADPQLGQDKLAEIFEYTSRHGVSVKLFPSLLETYAATIDMVTVAGQPLLELKRTSLDGWGKIAKRLADILLSSVSIVVFSPVMLITAIAIKLDSKGPIFFSRLDDGSPSSRIGQFGRPFHYFKFRSMHPNTHSQRYYELAHLNVRDDGPMVKIAADPRVTRVGKIIRKLSIDELPELFLVFIGKMSLVGPRPHLPEEVANYKEHQKRVLAIKPGMTGMAQISGRSELPFDEEVRLDTFYIENWSLLLDLQILFKTPLAVIGSHKRKAS